MYHDNVHPSIGFKSCAYDGPITWQQSKDFFTKLVREYEVVCNNRTKSGEHEPFSKFTENKGMLYMHACIGHDKNIIEKMIAQLPPGSNYDSIGGKKGASSKRKRS